MKTKITENEIPCVDCITLSICINAPLVKDFISIYNLVQKCSILKNYVTQDGIIIMDKAIKVNTYLKKARTKNEKSM